MVSLVGRMFLISSHVYNPIKTRVAQWRIRAKKTGPAYQNNKHYWRKIFQPLLYWVWGFWSVMSALRSRQHGDPLGRDMGRRREAQVKLYKTGRWYYLRSDTLFRSVWWLVSGMWKGIHALWAGGRRRGSWVVIKPPCDQPLLHCMTVAEQWTTLR